MHHAPCTMHHAPSTLRTPTRWSSPLTKLSHASSTLVTPSARRRPTFTTTQDSHRALTAPSPHPHHTLARSTSPPQSHQPSVPLSPTPCSYQASPPSTRLARIAASATSTLSRSPSVHRSVHCTLYTVHPSMRTLRSTRSYLPKYYRTSDAFMNFRERMVSMPTPPPSLSSARACMLRPLTCLRCPSLSSLR